MSRKISPARQCQRFHIVIFKKNPKDQGKKREKDFSGKKNHGRVKEHARFEGLWKSPAAAAELGREDTRMQEVAQGSFRPC